MNDMDLNETGEVFSDLEKLKMQLDGRIAAIGDDAPDARARRQAFQDCISMIDEMEEKK